MIERGSTTPNAQARPKVCPAIVLWAGEEGYRAFDVRNRALHRLNATAALIMEMADGSRSEPEILAALAPIIGPEKAQRGSQWITRAIEQGLLFDSTGTAPNDVPDADTLATIANDLRWDDDVRTAFQLQKQAAELAPGDADHWYRLGELAHINGDRETARAAYETYLRSYPDDAEVHHILIALRNEPPPARASDACIDLIYRRFATFYESNMCEELEYQAPAHLAAALSPWLKNGCDLEAVDLGCGTGLFGQRLRPHCRRLSGVDLSPDMLEKAREKGVYDDLHQAELTHWLQERKGESFDLIACCDTLIYFGDLTDVIRLAVAALKPGGIMGFTLEKSDRSPLELGDSGRFRHHRNHIREAAKAAGISDFRIVEKVLRKEYGENVAGLVTVLRKG